MEHGGQIGLSLDLVSLIDQSNDLFNVSHFFDHVLGLVLHKLLTFIQRASRSDFHREEVAKLRSFARGLRLFQLLHLLTDSLFFVR